ncbi:MAG: hypothetical protein NWQ13_09070 [Glaciimonas sp.]|nr:hypothetical protein [Glaciimonas sp.]
MRKIYAAALTLLFATFAYAQEGARVSLNASKPQVSTECRNLQNRITKLNRMDDERIARANQGDANKHPRAHKNSIQTREWVNNERKDAKIKMFFAKC